MHRGFSSDVRTMHAIKKCAKLPMGCIQLKIVPYCACKVWATRDHLGTPVGLFHINVCL